MKLAIDRTELLRENKSDSSLARKLVSVGSSNRLTPSETLSLSNVVRARESLPEIVLTLHKADR